MGAHGEPWGAHSGVFVEQWVYHKAPMGPQGLQEGLMPHPPGPPKKSIFLGLGGSGSQVWSNRAILWGSKATCPGMVLAPFWTDFGLPKHPFMINLYKN